MYRHRGSPLAVLGVIALLFGGTPAAAAHSVPPPAAPAQAAATQRAITTSTTVTPAPVKPSIDVPAVPKTQIDAAHPEKPVHPQNMKSGYTSALPVTSGSGRSTPPAAPSSPVRAPAADPNVIDYTLSGRLTNSDGNAVALSNLYVYSLSPTRTTQAMLSTDYDGNWTTAVPAGDYAVWFLGSLSTMDGWYSNTGTAADPDGASAIHVTSANVTGLDAVLPVLHQMSGRITDAVGNPLSGITVTLYRSGKGGTTGRQVTTGFDGTYSAVATPGTYVVGIADNTNTYASGWYTATGFTSSEARALSFEYTSAADLSLGDTRLPLTTVVSGKVTGASGASLPYAEVDFYIDGYFYGWVYTNGDGTYEAAIGPGDYHVFFYDWEATFAPVWHTATGVTTDSAFATNVTVASSTVSNLNATLPTAKRIHGRAFAGSPAWQDITVSADQNERWVSFGVSDSNGYFTIPVVAGSYVFYISSPSFGWAWQGPSGWTIRGSEAKVYSVTSDFTMDVHLPESGLIGGDLTNDLNLPVYGIDVFAFMDGVYYDRYAATAGWYIANMLPLGHSYKLYFADPYGRYGGGWYTPSGLATSYANATPVALTTGGVTGVSIQMPRRVAPSAPTGVTATPYNGSAHVTWTAPASDGWEPVALYYVSSVGSGDYCTSTGALSCDVAGLTNGQSYTFTVTASNLHGTSPASAASAPVTPVAKPEAPVNPRVMVGNGAASVSWTAPATNGSAITGYTVTSTPASAGCTTNGATFCTITGLTNGTWYTFSVTATNTNGTSRASSAAPIAPNPQELRAFGADRYGTATSVSANTFKPNCGCTVYIAYAMNFPDALAGAAAAGMVPGPVLLADTLGPINSATIAELTRLQPSKIVVLGSSGVVSSPVFYALEDYAPVVVRYYGPDRYATAAAISRYTFTNPAAVDAVYIAYSMNFPDALAGAAASGLVHGPVLLANTTGAIDPSTVAELQRLQPKKIVVLGSAGVISDAVFNALKTYSADVVRYSTSDRFGTAAAVSRNTFTDITKVDAVYIAYAFNFPDALAGAAAAGTIRGPVLLVNTTGAIDPSTVAELQRLQPRRIIVLGSTGVISASVFTALQSYLAF